MTTNPEAEGEPVSQAPEGVLHIPEAPEIPREIEQGGVQATPTQFTAQVQDDAGQQLINTPTNPAVTIELPKPQQILEVESLGSLEEAKTWSAFFWLRLLHKALKKGWRILVKGGS